MSINGYRKISQCLTLESAYKKDGRLLNKDDLDIIDNAAIVFDPNEILWVGKDSQIPQEYKDINYQNLEGKCITPGIVDCHTHLVFAGNRSDEYTMRLNGADYEEIAQAGGGILHTSKATNEATKDELFNSAVTRLNKIYDYGVRAIEIKSGYGLNYKKEKELSLIIHDLKKKFKNKIVIHNTYMAAHAVPKEFSSSSEYIKTVVIPLLEELSSLNILDSVDIFHEKGYFDKSDVELLFKKSQELNINTRSHADEFQDNKGAVLACKYNCLSTDHLLRTRGDGIKALANSNTVATLLPGTGFFLGKEQVNAREFLDAGVRVAIGSDYNPGSCHWDNVLKVAFMSAPTLGLNVTELWSAITVNAAKSLNLKNHGALMKGMDPSFTIFDYNSISEITYRW